VATQQSKPGRRFEPQLDVAWEKRSRVFLGDVRAYLFSPAAPLLAGRHVFYDAWLGQGFPARALTASVLLHVAFLIFPVPNWHFRQAEENPRESERVQLTWFGPARDLPPLLPPAPKPRGAAKSPAPAPPGRPTAVNRRQTIVSTPLRPNHPRQTLIQPDAPPTPPKILPPLPNIVQWSGPSRPARPKPLVTPLDVRRARRRARAQRPVEELPLPAVPNNQPMVGELNIAATAPPRARPRMPVAPMSVPQAGPSRAGVEAGPAPEIASPIPGGNGGDGLRNLVALSADPAPPSPNLEIPLGNTTARFAVGPSLTPGPGTGAGGSGAGGAGTGSGGGGTGGNGTGGGGSGPPGVFVSAGNPESTSSVAGAGSAGPSRPLPSRPEPRGPLNSRELRAGRPGSFPAPGAWTSPPLDPYSPSSPEITGTFGMKRVYTLHVNMPNLTSAMGSWILHFSELNPDESGAPQLELSSPVPLRKVDPRYPPVLAEARIEGDVMLYAIIRENGSVDSIRVLRSVDVQLDRNAMDALARWQFRPARRGGSAVDVEAVVTIPFRLARPL
jgi:protein TonB